MDTGRLAGAVVEAANEERRRIARDLHDGLQMQLLQVKAPARKPEQPGALLVAEVPCGW